ncbi:Short-chain dehydrogenase TIC 32, chloroplastic [Capsicum baccatum]|uniref:Short-chain dehydrogenase TIC 32, chloroplastic n=1 Tax=Capsicum baccatum TaxID=33114 RepID=A0A2G2W3A6_CAPBA|nr:Short-chain dehydrogenase TIC 32, chloroplastic [Capsicum baccatum]
MWIFGRKGASGFSACSTAEEVTQGIDGSGLTAIVTGATSGIGIETTRVLALHGVHVIMAIRNIENGKKIKENIIKSIPNAKIDFMELNLSSMESIRKFAKEYNSAGHPLNILIYNKLHAYGQSKLANILHSNELAKRLKGASTTCYVALHPKVKGVSGEYFSDNNIATNTTTSLAKDSDLAKKLWEFSLDLTNPK